LLLLATVTDAQLIFVTNNNTITITGYSGNGFGQQLVIPSITNGYPVVNIADNAFYEDLFLSAVIPDTVTNIGVDAFYKCIGLTNVAFGSNIVIIGDGAFAITDLTSVTIPNSVVSIGAYAFQLCGGYHGLNSMTIGSGVTNIGDLAFQNLNMGRYNRGMVFLGNAPTVTSATFNGDIYFGFPLYYLPTKSGWGPTLGGYPTIPWFPKIATANSDFGVLTNGFGFDINWAVGQTVFVDACADLTSSNWVPLETNTLAPSDTIGDGTFYFSDPAWANFPTRFYRVRAQ
jgi:hypothetical protein